MSPNLKKKKNKKQNITKQKQMFKEKYYLSSRAKWKQEKVFTYW